MATDTIKVLFTGVFAVLGPNEGNLANGYSNALSGTYGGAGNELFNSLQEAIATDTTANSRIDFDDEAAPEIITINGVDKINHTGIFYNATVTFTNGTSGTFGAVVIQTTDGELYVMPELSNNAENALLTSLSIASITLDTINVGFTNITEIRLDPDVAIAGDEDTSGDLIDRGSGPDTIFGGGVASTTKLIALPSLPTMLTATTFRSLSAKR